MIFFSIDLGCLWTRWSLHSLLSDTEAMSALASTICKLSQQYLNLHIKGASFFRKFQFSIKEHRKIEKPWKWKVKMWQLWQAIGICEVNSSNWKASKTTPSIIFSHFDQLKFYQNKEIRFPREQRNSPKFEKFSLHSRRYQSAPLSLCYISYCFCAAKS